jgi:transcription initiation factor IIF auxiliary subunit
MIKTVSFNNYSLLTKKKYDQNWYEWCVFVDDSPADLNSIKAVEYTLHPSFPDPIRLVKDRASRFALFSAGWGGFTIKARVIFSDDSSLNTSYFLRLQEENWPKELPQTYSNDETRKVYEALIHEKYQWRQLDTIVKNTQIPREKVVEILDQLRKENLARKAYYPSINNKDLWGATAIVGITPRNEEE